ncbi:MAG: DUF2410 domain-containing protein, partial [Terriglobus roseus]|nr:DUF2410 domain-containing protein [Terriglobus roseus]
MDKANGTGDGFSLTTLRRWSCGDSTRLPAKEEIKALHVYDFDNTLFSSPLPNKQLWAPATIGQLQAQDLFVNGGWWHDSSILAATGNGVEVEETRAWERWWNEQTVELVKLSMAQKDALCVLLTGRSEASFPPLIKRIIAAKGLRFDLLCLKPDVGPDGVKFHSTMHFKQAFLATLIRTYSLATTIRIYEDRIKHVQGFRKFFDDFNLPLLQQSAPHGSPLRQPITADVVHVAEEVAHLEPDAEVAAVQRMINIHNTAVRNGTAPHPSRSMRIQRKIVFTAYLIAPDASARLQSLVQFPANMPPTAHDDVKMLANGI